MEDLIEPTKMVMLRSKHMRMSPAKISRRPRNSWLFGAASWVPLLRRQKLAATWGIRRSHPKVWFKDIQTYWPSFWDDQISINISNPRVETEFCLHFMAFPHTSTQVLHLSPWHSVAFPGIPWLLVALAGSPPLRYLRSARRRGSQWSPRSTIRWLKHGAYLLMVTAHLLQLGF